MKMPFQGFAGTKFTYFTLQKETPSAQLLHLAALQGNVALLTNVLDSGKVYVDCKDQVRSAECSGIGRLPMLLSRQVQSFRFRRLPVTALCNGLTIAIPRFVYIPFVPDGRKHTL